MLTRTLAVLALVAVAAPAFADEIAGNGGFEVAGNTAAEAAFWSAGGGGAPGTLAQRDSTHPFAGQWAQHLVAVGSNLTGASSGVTQNSAALGQLSLVPGSSLSLSFNADYNFGPGGVAFYALRILNSAGGIVADTTLQTVATSTNGYQAFTAPTLTVPAFGAFPNDAFYAFVEFDAVAGAFDGSTSSAFIDNVSVQGTTVPAPAGLALISGGLLLAGRRRRA